MTIPSRPRTSEDATICSVEYRRIGIAIVPVKKNADQNSAPVMEESKRRHQRAMCQLVMRARAHGHLGAYNAANVGRKKTRRHHRSISAAQRGRA